MSLGDEACQRRPFASISTSRRTTSLALARAAKGAQLVENMRLARHCVVCPAQQAALNGVRSVVASLPISVAGFFFRGERAPRSFEQCQRSSYAVDLLLVVRSDRTHLSVASITVLTVSPDVSALASRSRKLASSRTFTTTFFIPP